MVARPCFSDADLAWTWRKLQRRDQRFYLFGL
jgi:hypothetical protein